MLRDSANDRERDAASKQFGGTSACTLTEKNDCGTHRTFRNAIYTSFAYPPNDSAPPDSPQRLTDMTRSRFFLCALVAFAVLSVADFALTRYLLHGSDTAYEANPVANLMLEHHGWTGLAAFKSAATLLFVGVVAVVHCCRPRAGKRLLAFGCAALGLVVIYSTTLAVRGHAQPGPGNDAVLEDREAARLSAVQAQDIIYRSVVQQVSAGLAPGHLTLADAVERLAATEKANDRTWLRTLHAIYPGLTDRGCLAAAVVGHTLGYLNLSRADAQRLLAELYALCGTDSPTSFGPILVRCDWIQSS